MLRHRLPGVGLQRNTAAVLTELVNAAAATGGTLADSCSYAFGNYGIGVQAEAGADGSPYLTTGYGAAGYEADENTEPSSSSSPPRQGGPRRFDRDRPRQRSPHVTGEAAIRAANEANRAIGAMPDQLAIESRHKRYPRP